MRLGVLDVGSNSAQLQIVDVAAGAPPLPALAVKTPTLLGEEAPGSDNAVVVAAAEPAPPTRTSTAVTATRAHLRSAAVCTIGNPLVGRH